jgi:hypothetical protein
MVLRMGQSIIGTASNRGLKRTRPGFGRGGHLKASLFATSAVILGCLSVGCGGSLPEPWTVAGARDKDWARAEALMEAYRQGSARYGSGLGFCVELDREADPSRVLRRLKALTGQIWKSDRCVARGLTLVEAFSGRQALLAVVEGVELLEAGRARVQAGFLRGPLSGEGRELILEFTLGQWVVTSSKDTWVS